MLTNSDINEHGYLQDAAHMSVALLEDYIADKMPPETHETESRIAAVHEAAQTLIREIIALRQSYDTGAPFQAIDFETMSPAEIENRETQWNK